MCLCWSVTVILLFLWPNNILDPVEIMRDASVNSRCIDEGATGTEACDTDYLIETGKWGTDELQWATGITVTSVARPFFSWSTSAYHTRYNTVRNCY